MHEEGRLPLKGAESAQKALQRSEETETRELLGGTEEKSISPIKGHVIDLPSKQYHDFYLAMIWPPNI